MNLLTILKSGYVEESPCDKHHMFFNVRVCYRLNCVFHSYIQKIIFMPKYLKPKVVFALFTLLMSFSW